VRAFVTKRPLATCIAVLALLCAWLFSATLLSGKVLAPEDMLLLNGAPYSAPAELTHASNPLLFDAAWVLHPDMRAARRQLRDFQLPIWSSMTGSGQPLLASQQNAALFPLNWIADVFPFWQSLEWVAALKVLLAAIGMMLLLRGLGLRPVAGLFGAIAYAFSMALVLWLEHPHSNAYVLMPWVLAAADAVIRIGGPRRAAALALAVGLTMLGGQPESAFLVMTAALIFAVTRMLELGEARRLGWLAAGTGIGVALGAVMLVPFSEMLGQATSASRSEGPGPHWTALSFFLPELWGRPDKFQIAGEPLNFQERTAYFGAIPLLFAVGGLVARRRAPQIAFAAIFLVGLALAIDIPLLTNLLSKLPGLDQVNRLRGLILCELSGAALAAYGLDALLSGDRRLQRLVAVGAGIAVLPPLIWLCWHTPVIEHLGRALDQLPVQGQASTGSRALAFAGILRWLALSLVGLAVVVVAIRRPRAAGAVAALVIAVTGLDLVSLDRGYHPSVPLAWANPPTPPAIDYMRNHLGHSRLAGGNEFGPDLAARYSIRDARIHALPALQRRNDVWFSLGGAGYLQRMWLGLGPSRLANLISARYVIFGPLANEKTGQWGPTPYPPLYENRFALPRAWMAYDWTPSADREAAVAALGKHKSEDDFNRPIIEGSVDSSETREPGIADFTEDGDTKVTLQVDAATAGYVILNDTYYPGWKAEVDGHDAEIKPANVWFRAVAVPAGSHTVKFVYRPGSVIAGLILSVLAALLIVVGLLWRRA
jgi:hypothetical protein